MTKLATMLGAALLLATLSPAQETDAASLRRTADAAVASQDWQTAIANFRKLTEAEPADARAWHMLGYSLHASGKLDEALEVHMKAAEFPTTRPVASYNAACVYALRGDKDKAFHWLSKAAKAGFTGLAHMSNDTDMDDLRGDPRYAEVVELMKKNGADENGLQVFAGSFDRKLARMALFGNQGAAGSVSVTYGQPAWKDSYQRQIDSEETRNRRWRFGKDEWTTLKTDCPLSLGDATLEPGLYYLTLERRDDGSFVMACLDPAAVHKYHIDPFTAHMTKGGVEVALEHSQVDEVAGQLRITLEPVHGKLGSGRFVVAFGPHRLTAPLEMQRGDR